MSNMATSPGSRPLEQLKVTELRDELKKRGLSLKGVKKELFERLEEAMKKEEQEGIVHGESEATQEGAHKMGTLDETDDVEGEEEVIDESKGDATNSQDNATTCQNSASMDGPLPTTEGLTASEAHASPGVSARDQVPGSNEEREQLCTADGFTVENNNDVVCVDNAVHENGEAVIVPENASNVVDVVEPCNTCIIEHAECANDEKIPDIVRAELADSERVNVLPESGSASDVVENVQDPPMENVNSTLAAGNAVHADNASGNICSLHDGENANVKDDKLFIPDANPSSEPDDKFSMQPSLQVVDSGEPVERSREEILGGENTERLIVTSSQFTASQKVVEPHVGMKSEELEGHSPDERNLINYEDKNDVKLEEAVKHEITSEGGLEKSVSIEPMEIEARHEAQVELRNEIIRDVKMELEIDKDDCTQLKNPPGESQLKEVKSEHDYARESRGEENANRAPDDWRLDKKGGGVNVKAVENDQARINLKRKDHAPERDAKQEPAKRMRRWNSGKEVVVDALKPLTTDSMKDIMLPESAAPKTVATSRALPVKVKVEPETINNTRTVPPPTRTPSNSLKIERFVRPFTLKAVKDLLADFGQCVDFWMDQIKTHCFVTYSSVNEAVAARNGLYGRQWPPFVGNYLVAEFVDVSDVKIRSEGLVEKAQAAPTPASMRVSNSSQLLPPRVGQSVSSMHTDPSTVPPSRFSRDIPPPPIPKKEPEPAVVTLEDLFFKTKAKPHIYYLPLTDEQVAEKIKKKQAVR